MRTKILLLVLTLVHTHTVYAQTVYKGVDANGKVIYSDTPFENSEEVKIEPLPTYSTPKLNQTLEAPKTQAAPIQYQVQIISPNNAETFSTTVQNIEVKVSVTPELLEQDRVQLLVNGQPQGGPTHSLSFNLGRLDRGAYILEAQIIDMNAPNKPKATSSKVTVYQQRAHINQ